MADALPDDCRAWMGATPLLDLEDTRLRLKARALTQLCHSERETVLALYAYVKRLPFAKPMKLTLNTAREVMDRQRGDADDKATLLVALLRACGIPARLHYIALSGHVLAGLTSSIRGIARPVVEAWVQGAWAATDTYIFDARFVAAARRRLETASLRWGYGIAVRGDTLWDGTGESYLTGAPEEAAEVLQGSLGRFHDPDHFLSSPECRERYGGLTRLLQWNVLASRMDGTVEALRQEGA